MESTWIVSHRHMWYRDKDGDIDMFYLDYGYHNGPGCMKCGASFCEHCAPDWADDPCSEPHYVCKNCGQESMTAEAFCPQCGAVMRNATDGKGEEAASLHVNDGDKKFLVFISGKMTGLPDFGRESFRLAEKRLSEQGYAVLNPAWLPAETDRSRCLPICLSMIDAADAVYFLQNWTDSPGARIEHAYAEYQGKTLLYQEEGV